MSKQAGLPEWREAPEAIFGAGAETLAFPSFFSEMRVSVSQGNLLFKAFELRFLRLALTRSSLSITILRFEASKNRSERNRKRRSH